MAEIEHGDLEINEHVYALRDEASVFRLSNVVAKAKRGLIIGNGGIATEFA